MIGYPPGALIKNTGVGVLQTHPSDYEWIISIKHVETNDINGSQLAEQGALSGRGTLVVIMQNLLSLVSEGSGLAKWITLLSSAIY